MVDYLAQITATHCCVCRTPLTDAESVEHGIGPVCSRRYYNPLHTPTEEQLQVALGHLAISGLDDDIIDKVLAVIGNDHVNARMGCNLLIKWASAHYADRDVVFKCANVIRALGYTELADKLEADRTTAIVLVGANEIEIYVPDKYQVIRELERIPGSHRLRNADGTAQKKGAKVGWTIPVAHGEWLNALLGVYFHGQLMCGTGGIRKIPHASWSTLAACRAGQTTVTTPTTPTYVTMTQRANGWVDLHTPYNGAFLADLKAKVPYQSRSWTGSIWTFDAHYITTVRTLVLAHFGVAV